MKNPVPTEINEVFRKLFSNGDLNLDETTAHPGKPGSIVRNGGFEQWSPLAPQRQREAMVRNVVLAPDHLAPEGWLPGRELGKQQSLTGKILPDAP